MCVPILVMCYLGKMLYLQYQFELVFCGLTETKEQKETGVVQLQFRVSVYVSLKAVKFKKL